MPMSYGAARAVSIDIKTDFGTEVLAAASLALNQAGESSNLSGPTPEKERSENLRADQTILDQSDSPFVH